jgi:uroporphyrinogen-III synthase
VVVTRAEEPGGPLGRRLATLGATVLYWQVVQIRPPGDTETLERKLGKLREYDWIVFSSPRAVAAVAGRVMQPSDGPLIAAAGSSTAAALEAEGWAVDLVPTEGAGGEALIEEFGQRQIVGGMRVLFPASSIARETIPSGLTRLGAQVDSLIAYETVQIELDRASCLAEVNAGQVHAVTFTSPSTVEGLRQCLGAEPFMEMLNEVAPVVIGSTTAQSLEDVGVARFTTADPSTLDGLVEAVVCAINARSN